MRKLGTLKEEKKHAEFSPSSLESFERCPGFRNRNTTSKSSERGDRIHKALEKGEVQSLDDQKERHVAQVCQDFIDGLLAERRPAVPDNDFREITLTIDLGSDIQTFGTCDRLFIYGPEGFMLDYKSGYREVSDAEFNPQAWAYVIGAFQRFPSLEKITFYFLVPNRDEVLEHKFARSDITGMQLRLNTIIRKAMLANPAQFRPQPELCEYCDRQATCPALAKLTMQFASKMRDDLEVPIDGTISIDRPEDIPKLLRLAPLLEAQADGIRKEALRLNLEEGIDIPGFSRVGRIIPRSVTSVLGAYEAVKDAMDLEDFLTMCSTVSVPQLEDHFASIAKHGKKGAARKELELRLRKGDVLRDEGTRYYLRENKK